MNTLLTSFLIIVKVLIAVTYIVFFFALKGKRFKVFLIILGAIITEFISVPNYNYRRPGRVIDKERACFMNQRVIMGNVEMYNMDHNEEMKTLDLDLLVKTGYQKALPDTSKECEYVFQGDKRDIVCKTHGNWAEVEERREKAKKSLPYILQNINETGYFGGIVYFVIAISLWWFFR